MRIVARAIASPHSLFEEMRSRDMLRECIMILVLASALASVSTAASYLLVSIEFAEPVPDVVAAEVSRIRLIEAIVSALTPLTGWLLATALAHVAAMALGGYGGIKETASITLVSLSAMIPYYLLYNYVLHPIWEGYRGCREYSYSACARGNQVEGSC